MKTTIKIPKSRMTAPIDFGDVLQTHTACGVRLSYAEYGFMQFSSNKIVMFDAYSTAHKYEPFDSEFGVVAFPFYFGCMTDEGERVVYCGLRFGEEKIDSWKPMGLADVLGKIAVDPDAASVPISSGVCCIADETAYELFRAHLKDEIHPLSGQIVLDGQTHTAIELYGKKYAVFSTGWGDGKYRCYAGLTKDGRAMMLLVDFGMIDYPPPSSELVDVEIETSPSDLYVYDPTKSERENNIARLTQIIETETDTVKRMHAYSRRGYAYHSMNNIDAALGDYLAAVGECKSITQRGELLRAWSVYDNAAEIFCARSDYESAIKLMNDALDVGDNFYAGAYVRLIDLYQLTKRTDKARETAERMLEARPGDPVANMKYAECCVSAMDYAAAAEAYERLASKFKLYENLFDEASCFIELGDYGKADAVLESHPAKEYYEQYWYYKAYIDYKQRRFTDALIKAQRSYGIDGEYMPALYLLIDIESVLQEYHAVARYAEEYIRLRPDKEYGYSVCGEAQLILGNFSESLRNYRYLYEKVKRDDKYAALAAMLAAKTGDKKACSIMLRLLKRRHSTYYNGAALAINVIKHRPYAVELEKAVDTAEADSDFMLQLAVYLTETNNVLPATRVLEALCKSDDPPYEIVAQQIRLAEKIDDKKHFKRFLDYYIDKYIGKIPEMDRHIIARRFIRDRAHARWLDMFADGAPIAKTPPAPEKKHGK